MELETSDITTLLGVSPPTPLAGGAEASNSARTPAVARKTPTPLSGGTMSSEGSSLSTVPHVIYKERVTHLLLEDVLLPSVEKFQSHVVGARIAEAERNKLVSPTLKMTLPVLLAGKGIYDSVQEATEKFWDLEDGEFFKLLRRVAMAKDSSESVIQELGRMRFDCKREQFEANLVTDLVVRVGRIVQGTSEETQGDEKGRLGAILFTALKDNAPKGGVGSLFMRNVERCLTEETKWVPTGGLCINELLRVMIKVGVEMEKAAQLWGFFFVKNRFRKNRLLTRCKLLRVGKRKSLQRAKRSPPRYVTCVDGMAIDARNVVLQLTRMLIRIMSHGQRVRKGKNGRGLGMTRSNRRCGVMGLAVPWSFHERKRKVC